MNTTPKKRPMLNFLKNVFSAPIIRGTIKTIPVGNLVYEIADTVKWYKDKKRLEKEGKASEVPAPPHSAVSMLFQSVFLFMILYAFFTKQITIDDVMKWISPDDFKNFGTITTNVTDSLSVQ